jgi:hypothetical protein
MSSKLSELENIQVQIQNQSNQSLESTRRMVQMLAEVSFLMFFESYFIEKKNFKKNLKTK